MLHVKLYFIALYFLMVVPVLSQTNNSPYSIIGVGDIDRNYADRSAGMANTGLALSSSLNLYHSNPAAYVALEKSFFIAELNARYKSVTYLGKPIQVLSSVSNDLTMKKIVLAARLNNWWGAGFGLMQFSSANYSFSGAKQVIGTNSTVTASYEGDGGLNKIFFANGFRLTKRLSAGIEAAFLFGSLNQSEVIPASLNASDITTLNQVYLTKGYITYGVQYHLPLNKKWTLQYGGKLNLKTNLDAQTETSVTEGTTTIKEWTASRKNYFSLPVSYGNGLALKSRNITIAADYLFQNWSQLNYKGNNYTLQNSHRISTGIEYSNVVPFNTAFVEKYFLQAGAFYDQSYLNVYGESINSAGFTISAGAHSKRSPFSWQLSAEFGTKGTQNNNMVKENYMQLGLTLRYRDFLFTQGRKYN